MELLQRNQLVWLHPRAWQNILASDWDAQALEVLRHWAAASLPLVVARQRGGLSSERISVGLPAPTRWARRRLALDVGSSDISKIGFFPLLSGVVPNLPAALSGLQVRVYGSCGWQAITGMDYVHIASDMDVLVNARTLEEAINVSTAIISWSAPCRVDGEVVFPSGHAVAWRELLQAQAGAVGQVLVKHRQSAALMTLHELERVTDTRATADCVA
jgi:phosphoribosyl-dephospho-CoA transferase